MSKITNKEMLSLASSIGLNIPNEDLVEVRVRLNTSIKLIQDMTRKYATKDLIAKVLTQHGSTAD